jgi:hypothetical protein
MRGHAGIGRGGFVQHGHAHRQPRQRLTCRWGCLHPIRERRRRAGRPWDCPRARVEPASIDFGSAVVGSPSRARLSIVNSGDAPLEAPQTSMSTGSDPDFIVLHDQCDNAIAPGERCDVRLQLLPSKAGSRSAILGVEGDGQNAEVPLAGAGLESGPLTLAPAAGSSRDFGGVVVGSSLEAHFDVSNSTLEASGALTFAVNEPQFELLPPAAGDCEPGVTSLVDGQICRIRVGFTPARRGPVDASLLVTSANLRSTSLPLAGVGRQIQTLVAPDSVEFGEVTVGSAEADSAPRPTSVAAAAAPPPTTSASTASAPAPPAPMGSPSSTAAAGNASSPSSLPAAPSPPNAPQPGPFATGQRVYACNAWPTPTAARARPARRTTPVRPLLEVKPAAAMGGNSATVPVLVSCLNAPGSANAGIAVRVPTSAA